MAVENDDVDLSFSPMTKDRWERDADMTCCGICNAKYSLLQRKHHCRRCGKLRCDSCAPKSAKHDDMRICMNCLVHELQSQAAPSLTSDDPQ